MKSGYLYVLVHPSNPDLYKIGVTTLTPEERLAQHNRLFEEYAGRIVKETGLEWELKTYIAVPDPYWAERAFWSVTPFPLIPFRGGIEIEKMDWRLVEKGLDAAKQAGIRPPPEPQTKPKRNHDWMVMQLEGTGLSMIGHYRGLVTSMEFRCEQGHEFKAPAGVVANRKSCPVCLGKVASTLD
jgi:T5orf172 domain